jgi:hypothetical protein
MGVTAGALNTWRFDMDDVKAAIEQATDAMGTPPEAPAEAARPEVKKVGHAEKKIAPEPGPRARRKIRIGDFRIIVNRIGSAHRHK